jgi:hypothetical protein
MDLSTKETGMTIDRIQSPNLERRTIAAAGYSQGSARSQGDRGTFAPDDRVVVSEQARQLSAGGTAVEGTGLKLDFKQLRALAFATPSAMEFGAGASE